MVAGGHVKNERRGGGLRWIVAGAAALLAAAAVCLWLLFVFAGGQLISRSAREVDLNGAGLTGCSSLLRLKAPEKLDLRGNDISAGDFEALTAAFPDCEILWDVPLGGGGEAFDCLSESVSVPVFVAEKAELYALMPNLREVDLRGAAVSALDFELLQSVIPDCHILWDIPIGGESFDCTSESVRLCEFTTEEAALFTYFENLRVLDAAGGSSYASYVAVEELLPDCDVRWSVAVGGQYAEPDTGVLELAGSGVSAAELSEKLAYLPAVERVVLGETDISAGDLAALRGEWPEIGFEYTVRLCGEEFSSAAERISLAGKAVDGAELARAAESFFALEELDLRGCGLGLEEVLALGEAYGGALVLAEVELYGAVFSTDATEIDLSGIEISDTTLIEGALPAFPYLEKVVMSGCGISDEDMDALNRRHEDVQFVWTVYFSIYSVRTDATAFCASNVPGYVAPKLGDAELAPIKYLTELEALDLGHMYYTDLSFLENMPHLRYLILVEANYRDISAIASLSELYYLEIFNNTIEDISPLLECKSLRHLNLGFTRGYDAGVLAGMTWLERLWYPGNSLSAEETGDIINALPDTECYFVVWDGDGSTGGGWREHESYYEMRDLFGMHYMPGGTGVPGNEE